MNDTTVATETATEAQSVTMRFEVTYVLTQGRTILDVTEAAKELLDKASEYGSVTGQIVFGRQKFSLR